MGRIVPDKFYYRKDKLSVQLDGGNHWRWKARGKIKSPSLREIGSLVIWNINKHSRDSVVNLTWPIEYNLFFPVVMKKFNSPFYWWWIFIFFYQKDREILRNACMKNIPRTAQVRKPKTGKGELEMLLQEVMKQLFSNQMNKWMILQTQIWAFLLSALTSAWAWEWGEAAGKGFAKKKKNGAVGERKGCWV